MRLTLESRKETDAPHGYARLASGITNLARNLFWAVASSVAGLVMQNLAFSAPLVIGGGTKVAYDLALYRAFRKLRHPEELETCARS